MKKIFFIIIFIFVFSFVLLPGFSFAPGTMGFPSSSSDNAAIQSQQQEEQEGNQFLDNLNSKTIACSKLKDADFEKIGEYFMGQSVGDTSRHIAMNEMMKSMMGEQGEEQMHIAWGKRGSGCDTSAAFSSQGEGFMPLSSPFGGSGWIFMILWWVLIIAGIVALIKWLTNQSRGNHDHEKSPLEILKERYAKGEIDKKEFEDKRKDLT